jgi:hypothetical protein
MEAPGLNRKSSSQTSRFKFTTARTRTGARSAERRNPSQVSVWINGSLCGVNGSVRLSQSDIPSSRAGVNAHALERSQGWRRGSTVTNANRR